MPSSSPGRVIPVANTELSYAGHRKTLLSTKASSQDNASLSINSTMEPVANCSELLLKGSLPHELSALAACECGQE